MLPIKIITNVEFKITVSIVSIKIILQVDFPTQQRFCFVTGFNRLQYIYSLIGVTALPPPLVATRFTFN